MKKNKFTTNRTKSTKALCLLLMSMLVFTLLPSTAFAATKAPKKTTITSISQTDNSVTLKWKKVKCYGYKVYRTINDGKRVRVKTLKASKRTYTNKVPKFVTGTVKYQVAGFNRQKIKQYYNTKTKKWVNKKPSASSYKGRARYTYKHIQKLSSAKTVQIVATESRIEPGTTEITKEIYDEYAELPVEELTIEEIRALVLYKINYERSIEHRQEAYGEGGVRADIVMEPQAPVALSDKCNLLALEGIDLVNSGVVNIYDPLCKKYQELNETHETYDPVTKISGSSRYSLEWFEYTKLANNSNKSLKSTINEWIDSMGIYNMGQWPYIKLIGVGFKDNVIFITFAG